MRGDFTRMSKPVSRLVRHVPHGLFVKAVNELNIGMLFGPLRLGAREDSVIVTAILTRRGGAIRITLIVIDDFEVNRVVAQW